ncbi:AAA family ATPase, partial [Caldithrix abyssi]
MITKIDVKNFKSFDHLNIELSNFNVVIGPNASGKSNFVQIFRFLKDIEQLGLENAVSLQGGVEYLR